MFATVRGKKKSKEDLLKAIIENCFYSRNNPMQKTAKKWKRDGSWFVRDKEGLPTPFEWSQLQTNLFEPVSHFNRIEKYEGLCGV